MTNDFYPQKIYVKLFLEDGKIKRYQSSSTNKIIRKIKANNFEKGIIKVSYGKKISVFGKMEEFDNESVPLSKTELLAIFQVFIGH
jgi:hypothetical protein